MSGPCRAVDAPAVNLQTAERKGRKGTQKTQSHFQNFCAPCVIFASFAFLYSAVHAPLASRAGPQEQSTQVAAGVRRQAREADEPTARRGLPACGFATPNTRKTLDAG